MAEYTNDTFKKLATYGSWMWKQKDCDAVCDFLTQRGFTFPKSYPAGCRIKAETKATLPYGALRRLAAANEVWARDARIKDPVGGGMVSLEKAIKLALRNEYYNSELQGIVYEAIKALDLGQVQVARNLMKQVYTKVGGFCAS